MELSYKIPRDRLCEQRARSLYTGAVCSTLLKRVGEQQHDEFTLCGRIVLPSMNYDVLAWYFNVTCLMCLLETI